LATVSHHPQKESLEMNYYARLAEFARPAPKGSRWAGARDRALAVRRGRRLWRSA
jgi:hypothetical protein